MILVKSFYLILNTDPDQRTPKRIRICNPARYSVFTSLCCVQLVLLCSSVGDKCVEEFATNEAIQATEIYEFVQLLGNHEYQMPTLQVCSNSLLTGQCQEILSVLELWSLVS